MPGSTTEPVVNWWDQPNVNQRPDNSGPQKGALPSDYQLITYHNPIQDSCQATQLHKASAWPLYSRWAGQGISQDTRGAKSWLLGNSELPESAGPDGSFHAPPGLTARKPMTVAHTWILECWARTSGSRSPVRKNGWEWRSSPYKACTTAKLRKWMRKEILVVASKD